MSAAPGEIPLSMDELRVVAGFAVASAEEVLEIFEAAAPEDPRPRAAVDAARAFVEGAPRGRLQRATSLAAHRAAREVAAGAVGSDQATSSEREAAAHAARSAGDAAAAAYLHPLARATQVGHILRATAHAARALELVAGDSTVGAASTADTAADPTAAVPASADAASADSARADAALARARARATPLLREVLQRYPRAPAGRGRVAQLMSSLDASLRSAPDATQPSAPDATQPSADPTQPSAPDPAKARALRFVQQEFPQARAAFLGGSSASGHATATSDLDVLIVLPAPWQEVAFVETLRFEGQLVEAFVYGEEALPEWLGRGRAQRRPVLDRLIAEGMPLITGSFSDELAAQSRVVLEAGPAPAPPDDLARRTYALSAQLDDLADRSLTSADPAETRVLTWTLWREAAELSLLTQRQWCGTGKWLIRALRDGGDSHRLAAWAEDASDTTGLLAIARAVLDDAGGYVQEGFVRGERPPDLKGPGHERDPGPRPT